METLIGRFSIYNQIKDVDLNDGEALVSFDVFFVYKRGPVRGTHDNINPELRLHMVC